MWRLFMAWWCDRFGQLQAKTTQDKLIIADRKLREAERVIAAARKELELYKRQ